MRRVSTRTHTTIAVLAFISLIPFIRLGDGDLHNDEVIYASRAQEILSTGNLLPHAPLKRMLGVEPPLAIWTSALSIKLFGFSSFSVRLVSAVSAVVLFIVFYWFALLFLPPQIALGATVILASSSLLIQFSQMAQLDAPWLACVVLAVALFWYSRELNSKKLFFASALLFGVSFSIKLLVSLLPLLAFLVWILLDNFPHPDDERRLTRREIVQYFGIVAGVALPWYIWALCEYGGEFLNAAFGCIGYEFVHSVIGGLSAPHDSGKLFYLNQVIIGFPVSAIAGVFFFYRIVQAYRNRPAWYILSSEYFLWIWLVVSLIVLTAMHAQMQLYSMLMLPPLAILSMLGVKQMSGYQVSAWWRTAAITAVLAACGWGVSQAVREGAKVFVFGASRNLAPTNYFIIIALNVLALSCIIVYLSLRKPKRINDLFLSIPTIGAAIFVAIRAAFIIADPTEHVITGAAQIGSVLPRYANVALISPERNADDAVMQFHCYDRSKTLYSRLSFFDLHNFALSPALLPDSDHYALLEFPDGEVTNDTSGVVAARSLEGQQYVVILQTYKYALFARGLFRE